MDNYLVDACKNDMHKGIQMGMEKCHDLILQHQGKSSQGEEHIRLCGFAKHSSEVSQLRHRMCLLQLY